MDLIGIKKLKRKAKAIEEEASVYEIGFETPASKKTSSQTKHVFAVPAEKNRSRRSSVFVETNQTNNDMVHEKKSSSRLGQK